MRELLCFGEAHTNENNNDNLEQAQPTGQYVARVMGERGNQNAQAALTAANLQALQQQLDEQEQDGPDCFSTGSESCSAATAFCCIGGILTALGCAHLSFLPSAKSLVISAVASGSVGSCCFLRGIDQCEAEGLDDAASQGSGRGL